MDQILKFFTPRSRLHFAGLLLAFVALVVLMVIIGISILYDDLRPVFWKSIILGVSIGSPMLAFLLVVAQRLGAVQEDLARIAATDLLTDLPNRRAFLAQVDQRQMQGEGGRLLMIDVDHFKSINDRYGHSVGDRCLVEISAALRTLVRRSDIIARFGGEEFAAFLSRVGEEEARSVADRIASGIIFLPLPDAEDIPITLSVGITALPPSGSIDAALREADVALYEAKAAGRARAIPFTEQGGALRVVG